MKHSRKNTIRNKIKSGTVAVGLQCSHCDRTAVGCAGAVGVRPVHHRGEKDSKAKWERTSNREVLS